jgi:glycosyltransferase involved in cell wall biosynthesis
MDPYTCVLHRLAARDLVLCHDVGPLTHGDLFDAAVVAAYRKIYAEIAAARPHMVFVSRASQSAFHALFGEAFASSRVIYPALRAEVTAGPSAPAPGVWAPFLLTVGSVGARKNQARAIEAFARSGLAAQGVQYVLCGAREPGYEAAAALAQQTPGVRLLAYVSDAELNWLYAHAAGFVLPSRLEGFGIPVAEAVARGLIPIVSEGGVLHEVAGEGALSVDPLDIPQIAAAMRTLVDMPAEQAAHRRERLMGSLGRFSQAEFTRAWRDALGAAVAGRDPI